MPKFKALNGSIIEVSEQHAEEVMRPQRNFKEVFEKPEVIIEPDEEIPKPVSKKKSKKKAKKE